MNLCFRVLQTQVATTAASSHNSKPAVTQAEADRPGGGGNNGGQYQISSSRSCPPGPWLPSTTSTAASSQLQLSQLPASMTTSGGHGELAHHNSGPPLSSSYSMNQRLNNQLSVDSSASTGGWAHGTSWLGPGNGTGPVASQSESLNRHGPVAPPQYSESNQYQEGFE